MKPDNTSGYRSMLSCGIAHGLKDILSYSSPRLHSLGHRDEGFASAAKFFDGAATAVSITAQAATHHVHN